jgi:hypothetical protein
MATIPQVVVGNRAATTLASALSISATTALLVSVQNFPGIGPGQFAPLVLSSVTTPDNFEIVYITAISNTTVTIERGQEGTSPQAFNPGDLAQIQDTAGVFALQAQLTGTNTWTAANTFDDPVTIVSATGNALIIEASGNAGEGAAIELIGNGNTTPNKTMRVLNGLFQIVNSAFTTAILTLTDAGAMTISGIMTAAGFSTSGNVSVGGTVTGAQLTSTGNINAVGSIGTDEGISALGATIGTNGINTTGGVVAGASGVSTSGPVSATGSISSGAFMTAGLGIASAPTNESVVAINSDFSIGANAVNNITAIVPKWRIQMATGTVTVVAGTMINTVTLPEPFPTNILGAIVSFAGSQPVLNVTISAEPASLNTVNVTTVGIAAGAPPGLGVVVLAIGN